MHREKEKFSGWEVAPLKDTHIHTNFNLVEVVDGSFLKEKNRFLVMTL